MDSWIRTAIMHNVVELDLCVEKDGSFLEDEHLELPKSLFMCRTLVVLNLSSIFVFNTPTSWCLPRLKGLSISVNHPGHDLMEELLPGCPALEELAISGIVGEGYMHFNISALELKNLRIYLVTEEDEISSSDYNDLTIFVTAPKLEYLYLEENPLSNCVLKNAKSLVKATIDLDCHIVTEHPGFTGRATALLAQICNVKSLSLSAHNLDGHNCDRLGGYGVKQEELLWYPPELVPNCLLSNVKTICIKEFQGREDEFEVAKYLLKNGEVLNSMKIYTEGVVCAKEVMLEKLLSFERVSKTCQVEID